MKRFDWQTMMVGVLVVVMVTAGLAWRRVAGERELMSGSVESARQQSERRARELEELRAKLSMYGRSEARDVSYVLPLMVAEITNAAARDGVGIVGISIEGLKEGAAAFVREQARPLEGGAGTRKIVLNMNGNYSNFTGLREFLGTIASLPIAISSISIRDGRLVLKLEVLGV